MDHELWMLYQQHQGICNLVIFGLVFGGMGRVAFWRESDGMRVGGVLVLGLGLLLSAGLLTWANETGRRVSEIGPWGAFLVIQAILILGWRTFTKSKDM